MTRNFCWAGIHNWYEEEDTRKCLECGKRQWAASHCGWESGYFNWGSEEHVRRVRAEELAPDLVLEAKKAHPNWSKDAPFH